MGFRNFIARVTFGLPKQVTFGIERNGNFVTIPEALGGMLIKLSDNGESVKVEMYFHDMWSDQKINEFHEKGTVPDESYSVDLTNEYDVTSSVRRLKDIIINGY